MTAAARHLGWSFNDLVFFFLLIAVSVHSEPTAWENVCVAERYALYEAELCPKVFFVSTLAFNPNYPNLVSNVTLILTPSQNLPRDSAFTQYVTINLPGFTWIGAEDPDDANLLHLPVIAKDAAGYDIETDPPFAPTAEFLKLSGTLRLTINKPLQLLVSAYNEVNICCARLPASSPRDDPAYKIAAPAVESVLDPINGLESIDEESILSTPYIDPGYQWEFLQVSFDPPISRSITTISLTLRSANDLKDRCRIILKLPTLSRVINESGNIGFNTAGSGDSDDWMLFDHIAYWNHEESQLRFSLREGKVLLKGQQVTLSTTPGEFLLPIEIPANWAHIEVEARSGDNIDEIIKSAPVMQSTRVPHVRYFKSSQLAYTHKPNGKTTVQLTCRTNRPMYAGSAIYLRLAGFQAEVIEVILIGNQKEHFLNERALFHLPQNVLELRVNKTLYSNELDLDIGFADLILPPSLYVDDSSLLIWNSDPDADKQSIEISPMVGTGTKTFIQSQVKFFPMERRMPANITFTLLPSVTFYQGDQVVLHLYGFMCATSRVPLIGEGASQIEDSAAHWDAIDYTLTLTVATNKIIGNVEPLIVEIGLETNCRLPDKLSQNDGILRIEGRASPKGTLIDKEPMKKVPMLGDAKYVIASIITFTDEKDQPSRPSTIARIRFAFILNSDVLPNSTINITLGGLVRDPIGTPTGVHANLRSGEVSLSGLNAPLFDRKGYWSQNEVTLSIKMIPSVAILSGEEIQFFIEVDQRFRLPYVAYPNDPSFRLSITEAGIPERPFHNSTRVSQSTKSFVFSDLYYGDRNAVAYPNTVTEVILKFRPNVDLPGGSILRITLPGFQLPSTTATLAGAVQGSEQVGEEYLSQHIPSGTWDQVAFTLDLEVPYGVALNVANKWVMRVMEVGGFRLPTEPLELNDPRLTIACIQNQIVYEEPIKDSPRVVDRSFMVSEFEYRPPQKESIFQMLMTLQPTVNITDDNDITIKLPGFRNSLSKVNIHIMGEDRHRITASMAQWNETRQELTLTIPRNQPIPAFTVLDLRIEESQGFILPQALNANDTRIQIKSENNIIFEPIKKSPMVGNGPFAQHRFCMYQYERGVRSGEPICTAAIDCDPPLLDPCSPEELERCGCNNRLDTVFPLTVYGFNLQEDDEIIFIPESELCTADITAPSVLSTFSPPTYKTVSDTNDRVENHEIVAVQTGYYRICVVHVGMTFDIGTMVVRPSCQNALVLVDGTCVEHCPKTKIPIAGNCLRDIYAIEALDRQAMMLPVKMNVPAISGGNVADRDSDDAELLYFIYRYTYELARLLDCDPKRIVVASLSNGSVLVNTVFTTVGGEDAIKATTERSPRALISLFQALQSDTSSQLHDSNFFKYVDRAYQPPPIPVRLCPDNSYRVFCPYEDTIMSSNLAVTIFVVGVILVPLLLLGQCLLAWRIDFDTPNAINEDVLEKVRMDHKQVDAPLQVEYAKSWLEGRFMGEDWLRARQSKMLAIRN